MLTKYLYTYIIQNILKIYITVCRNGGLTCKQIFLTVLTWYLTTVEMLQEVQCMQELIIKGDLT